MSQPDLFMVPVKYLLDETKITTVQDVVKILQSFGINYNDEIEGTPMMGFMKLNPDYTAYKEARMAGQAPKK